MVNFVDRRANPKGKNLPNRQRYLEREKARVRKAVHDAVSTRDLSKGSRDYKPVVVDVPPTAEPYLGHEDGGNRDLVLPGNREFVRGQTLKRPPPGGGGGEPTDAGQSGDAEDGFSFDLTREEYLRELFDQLELPDMVKVALLDVPRSRPERAGYTTSGSPTGINMRRTMPRALARRIGLGRPRAEHIAQLQAKIDEAVAGGDADAIAAARLELDLALKRVALVPWIDPIDIRFNRFEARPKPISRAVMFCLMDVSGSMTQFRKELAKRFYLLLQLFLEQRYKSVTMVFVRHTETAEEVEEGPFFNDPKTGGTNVSSGLRKIVEIQKERFPVDTYNIFVAQASDGDNFGIDRQATMQAMGEIMPMVQYFAYIETTSPFNPPPVTSLWSTYEDLGDKVCAGRLAMRRVSEVAGIYPVFADLFAKRSPGSRVPAAVPVA